MIGMLLNYECGGVPVKGNGQGGHKVQLKYWIWSKPTPRNLVN